LRIRSLRAAGNEKSARELEEEIFSKSGRRFSLLHATRGRPEQALAARNLWLRAAFVPLGVEHIFAVDADDAKSLEALKDYRHVVVEQPRGCVKAWNAAAVVSSGQVLIQLSDDWIPCHDWDAMIWEALEKADPGVEVGSIPRVVAVHDGHRTDALLCMAILTRARYERQCDQFDNEEKLQPWGHIGTITGMPYMFSPEYFGVFSDNEVTVRAYDDGIVVQAQHIQFDHKHPIFTGTKWEEMDETYRRQNAQERYVEGAAIFNRRNPKYAIKLP
jgi:hypothetical protein